MKIARFKLSILLAMKKSILEIAYILKCIVMWIEKFLWYNNTDNSYKKECEFKIKKQY